MVVSLLLVIVHVQTDIVFFSTGETVIWLCEYPSYIIIELFVYNR